MNGKFFRKSNGYQGDHICQRPTEEQARINKVEDKDVWQCDCGRYWKAEYIYCGDGESYFAWKEIAALGQ